MQRAETHAEQLGQQEVSGDNVLVVIFAWRLSSAVRFGQFGRERPRPDMRGAEQLISILVRKAPVSMPLIVWTLNAEFVD